MTAGQSEQGGPGVATGAGRELVLTRTFDAPRPLVFRAWVDPTQLGRWWGPHGFTNPVCEADARPGGAIRIDMAGPDGTVYPMTGTYLEVVEPERIVFTAIAIEDEQGRALLEIRNTVTFAEVDGRTTVTVRAVVVRATPEVAGAVAGMEPGWTQSLERLEAELMRDLLIARVFDSPRPTVFRAWTEADRLARWFGPKGFEMIATALDLRPGGAFHYGMRSPDGKTMWGRWVFREVVEPERLVFVASFSDEAGGLTRHPFAADWPLEVLSTVTFLDCGGRTMITMRGSPIDATPAEEQSFRSATEMMQKGWAGTLDQLAGHLAQA